MCHPRLQPLEEIRQNHHRATSVRMRNLDERVRLRSWPPSQSRQMGGAHERFCQQREAPCAWDTSGPTSLSLLHREHVVHIISLHLPLHQPRRCLPEHNPRLGNCVGTPHGLVHGSRRLIGSFRPGAVVPASEPCTQRHFPFDFRSKPAVRGMRN